MATAGKHCYDKISSLAYSRGDRRIDAAAERPSLLRLPTAELVSSHVTQLREGILPEEEHRARREI